MTRATSIKITPGLLRRLRNKHYACDTGFDEGVALVGKGLVFHTDPLKNLDLADRLLYSEALPGTGLIMYSRMPWLLWALRSDWDLTSLSSDLAFDETCTTGLPCNNEPYVLAQMMAMAADWLLHPKSGRD